MSKRLALFDKLIAGGSSDPFHYYARALELRSLGDLRAALAALVDVSERFPEYVPSYLIAAQLAHELGEPARARELAERGIAAAEQRGDAHAHSELSAFRDSLSG